MSGRRPGPTPRPGPVPRAGPGGPGPPPAGLHPTAAWPGLGGRLAVVDEQAVVLGSVTWGVEHLDADLTELDSLTVVQRPVGVAQACLPRTEHLNPAPVTDLAQPRQVVVVAVGVECVADMQPLGAGFVEIGVYLPLGVEQQCLTALLRAEEVGSVAQARQVELFEEHLRRASRICGHAQDQTSRLPRHRGWHDATSLLGGDGAHDTLQRERNADPPNGSRKSGPRTQKSNTPAVSGSSPRSAKASQPPPVATPMR